MKNFFPIKGSALCSSVGILCTFLLFSPQNAAASDAKVQWSTSVVPKDARIGEHVTISLEGKVPNGYHLYSMTPVHGGPLPLKVAQQGGGFEPVSEWHAPVPKVEEDPNFKKAVEYFTDEVSHNRVYQVAAKPTQPANLVVRGQICNEKECLQVRAELPLNVTVEKGVPRAMYSQAPTLDGVAFGPDRPAPSLENSEDATKGLPMGEGIVGFLIIAFLAGLGALVTPCVFPMIPITISFFSKFAKVSLRRSVVMASIYAVSIIMTFSLLGILVSMLFGAVGMQTLSASPWFNIILTVLLIVFAFNLFGLFEIQIPSALISRSSQKEHELTSDDGSLPRQALGVFFMAITFTLVSFTCTVGFIGIVLAEASKGNWFYPALGMLAFAMAFSLPFFILAIFPSWADKLRGKGGDWMVAVKVVLGFLEFAGAFKFLSNADLVWQWGLVSRPLVLAIWVAVFGVAGLYLLRVFDLTHGDSNNRTVGPLRMIFGVFFLALSVYSATGIRDTKSMGGWMDGWLPPAAYPGSEIESENGEGNHLPWIRDDIPGGMEQAKNQGKPLFVDFTGYTCTNCRYMEGGVFPLPSVHSRLKQMVLVTAYTDAQTKNSEKQRDYQITRFDTAALPFYAVINPYDDTVLATFASSTNNVSEYVAFLQKGLDKFSDYKEASTPAENHAPQADIGKYGDVSVDLAMTGSPVDFEFPALKNGVNKKLSELRGRWIFVNFWASWCAPCKEELKNEFPGTFGDKANVSLLTVAFDGEDTEDSAIAFANEVGLFEHTALQGPEDITEAQIPEAFQVSESLPLSYLIHPDGHIAWSRAGSIDRPLLDRLIAKTKATE